MPELRHSKYSLASKYTPKADNENIIDMKK